MFQHVNLIHSTIIFFAHSWNVNSFRILFIFFPFCIKLVSQATTTTTAMHKHRKKQCVSQTITTVSSKQQQSVDVHRSDGIPLIIIKRDINCQLACVNSWWKFLRCYHFVSLTMLRPYEEWTQFINSTINVPDCSYEIQSFNIFI